MYLEQPCGKSAWKTSHVWCKSPTPPRQGSTSPPLKGLLCQIPYSQGRGDSQMPVGCTQITWQKHHQEYWTIYTVRFLIYVSRLIQTLNFTLYQKTTIAWWIVQYHNYAILCPRHCTTIFQKYEAILMAFLMC